MKSACMYGFFFAEDSDTHHIEQNMEAEQESETTAIFTVHAFTFANLTNSKHMFWLSFCLFSRPRQMECFIIGNGFRIWIQSIRNLDFRLLTTFFHFDLIRFDSSKQKNNNTDCFRSFRMISAQLTTHKSVTYIKIDFDFSLCCDYTNKYMVWRIYVWRNEVSILLCTTKMSKFWWKMWSVASSTQTNIPNELLNDEILIKIK